MQNNRIVFMGTPQIACNYLTSLINAKHNIVGVVTQPPRKRGRGMQFQNSPVHELAILNKINIITPDNLKSNKLIDKLKQLNPELIVVMGYGKLLTEAILNLPKLGCINVHVSLLPRWRGPSPIEFSLINGDQYSGVSIFKIEKELDSGPIFAQKKIQIYNFENKELLTEKLNKIGCKLLIDILPQIFDQSIVPTNQNKKLVTYSKKINSNMTKIDFNTDVESVINKIRAFSPKPSAWFKYKNERIKIIKASKSSQNNKPSMILNNKFHIGCLNGSICIEKIQREGKKIMSLEEFLRGFSFNIGEKVNANI